MTIPPEEIELKFTPSGGPGGQHANRSSTRVEVSWNLDSSRALGPRQRELMRQNLRPRIDSSGTIRVTSDTFRSQLRNREEALERLRKLLARALVVPKSRRRTQPSRAARERRLADKKRRSELKRSRGPRPED